MASVKWTKEQERAIFSPANKMIVSASAGSGKTLVMIKRIVDIVVNKKEPLDSFLVVTFTKAAASEMKAKLLEALEELEEKDDFIKQQIHDIAVSNICTLDSFCAKLLKTYFYEVGLDPAFVVIDGAEKESLQNKAFDKLFEECFENFDREFFEISDFLSANRKLDKLKDVILKIYNFLIVQPEPDKFFYEKLESTYNEDLKNNPCVEVVNEEIWKTVESFVNKLPETYEMAQQSKNKSFIEIMTLANANLMRFSKNNTLEQNLRAIALYERCETRKPTFKGDDAELLSFACEVYKKHLNTALENLSAQFEDNETDVVESLKVTKRRILKLYSLVKRFEVIFSEMKKEKGLLDFSDLERFVYELLKNENVQESIKNKIKYVFVDEYQDINMLQENILQKLSLAGNVFLVGDVKQSIYAFRHCDPQIFLNKEQTFNLLQDAETVLLNHNFRSHKEILDFANSVFSRVMQKDFAGVDYKKEAMLIKGANEIGKGNDLPAVSVVLIEKNKKDKNQTKNSENEENEQVVEDFEYYSVLNHKNEEDEEFVNGELASKILADEILKAKERFIYLPKSKTIKERKAKFSDMVVLVSARDKAFEIMCEEFEKCGIPYVTDVDEQIFDDDFMCTLLNFLKVINNKNLDLELISVLSSEMFGFSFNELAEIKRKTKKHNFFYECVQEFIAKEEFAGEIQNRLCKFYDKIEHYVFLAQFMTVSDLICEIVKDEELELFALQSNNGSKKMLKLTKLLELLNGKSYNDNLAKYILNVADVGASFQNMGETDAVKITTIHKSKGLEYPLVFMPFVDKEFNFTDFHGDFLLDKKYGVCLNVFDVEKRTKFPTICMIASKLNLHKEIIKEKMRLFYVALTRPINNLCLIQNINKYSFNKSSLDHAISFSDFLNVLLKEKFENGLKQEEDIFELKTIAEKDINKNKNLIVNRNVEFSDNFANMDKIKKDLNSIFEFEYENRILSKIPQKISVSDINKNNDEGNIHYLFAEDSSSASIGNAYHNLLAHLDLKKNKKQEIKEQIDLLLTTGRLQQDELSLINLEHIFNLLNNPFFIEQINSSTEILKEQQFFSKMQSGEIFENNTTEQIIVFGVCDLILVQENKIIVVDYKTSKIKNENKLIEKYKKQLLFYSKAMRGNFNIKNCESFIYSFELNKFLKI